MPVLPGSVIFNPAATATAASAQLPPLRRTQRPHCEASGCVEDTMPFVLWTTERREGNWANWVAASAGVKADVERGILAVYIKKTEMKKVPPGGGRCKRGRGGERAAIARLSKNSHVRLRIKFRRDRQMILNVYLQVKDM